MSGVHKYPTISFRISPRERDEIEAKIKASGMQKKDYFVRSCIYNKVCVVGKKEVIYQLGSYLRFHNFIKFPIPRFSNPFSFNAQLFFRIFQCSF